MSETWKPRSAGEWAVLVLALVFIVFGLPIFAGGIWLITLGGSWYYLFAGLGLLVTGYFLIRRDMTAMWVYLLTFAGTVIWAFWESGLNGWAQVPRLVAPTVMLILLICALPVLRGRGSLSRRHAAAAASVLALCGGGSLAFLQLTGSEGAAHAQETQSTPLLAQLTEDEPAPATPVEETPPDPIESPAGEGTVSPEDVGIDPEPTAPPATDPADFVMPEVGPDWPAYGGSHHATRFSPLTEITKENVGELEVAWEFRTGDMPPADERFSNQNTPLKIGNRLFICSAMNKVFALDAATGLEAWRYDPGVSLDAIPYNATCRGLAYYATPGASSTDFCGRRLIMNTLDARLIALDLNTGQLCQQFGNGGIVNLLDGIGYTAPAFYAPTSPPTIVRNIAVVHSQVRDGQRREAPSGVVRGYDAETGELAWAWDMGRPGETGAPPDGEIYTPGTPNVWTIASGDNELGLVYLPTGNSAVDYWGGDRSEAENTYSTALVALDVTTGEVAWHYQTVHYDVWDYDLGSQGTLIDFPTEDGPVPALILPTKQSQFFVFNRATGELLVEVEERPAPQGGVEPERLSPTQPYVVDFPSLLKPDLEERHMWGMTPLDQLWCRIQYYRANYAGRYTPPSSDRPWIQYPGYNGGSDWGGVAIDTERGIMVANYNDTPNYNQLVPREVVDEYGIVPIDEPGAHTNRPESINPQAGTPYGIDVNAGWRVPLTGLLCKEPPYGHITAIDLNTREVLWDRPFGTARRDGPFGIPSLLPLDIGTPNNAGAVVTASGLVFIAAATDDLIRAIDIDTGDVLWQDSLPAGGQAGPAVYEANGRQYLVINAGGHTFMETRIGDYFIAYRLPG